MAEQLAHLLTSAHCAEQQRLEMLLLDNISHETLCWPTDERRKIKVSALFVAVVVVLVWPCLTEAMDELESVSRVRVAANSSQAPDDYNFHQCTELHDLQLCTRLAVT